VNLDAQIPVLAVQGWQVLLAEHFGAEVFGQSLSSRHWTQVLVPGEQKGVPPEQSVSWRHWTQAPVVV